MDQEDIKEKKLEDDRFIDEEPAPTFKDEIRAVGSFFRKIFTKSVKRNSEKIDKESVSKTFLENEDYQAIKGKKKVLEESQEMENESAPSFREELKGVVNFFKKIFNSADRTSKEIKKEDVSTIHMENEGSDNEPRNEIENKVDIELISFELSTKEVAKNATDDFEIKKRKWFSKKKKQPLTEEQIQQKKVKFYKGLSSTFLFLLVFFTVSFFGFTSTSKKEFCQSCHEMKPEHYTLMFSSHADVECVDCHTDPGLEEMFEVKVRTAGMFFKKATNKVKPSIAIKAPVGDAACNKCHNMKKRAVTHGGDWIIPHDKHAKNDIACVECHSGVAHGQIASRQLTLRANLSEWNEVVGKSTMSDEKYTKLTMDDCMECHTSRKITTKCEACHTKSVIPESHTKTNFIEDIHGTGAREILEKCHKCHQYNTPDPIEVVQEAGINKNGINAQVKTRTVITVENYILENKFCRECHQKRPMSHEGNFFKLHGAIASENERKCYSCHAASQTKSRRNPLTTTSCRSCHPAKHAKNKAMYKSHPVPLKPGDKINTSCFKCHKQSGCAECHTDFKEAEE